jgi:hypothetical protein
MSQTPYTRHNPVTVVDPDLSSRTLVNAWHQGVDKATGDHLVIIADEPDAVRRIKPKDVYSGLRVVRS